MTSSYSKTSVFVRPQKKSDKLAFLKNSTLRTLFLTCVFGIRERRLRVDGKLKRKKESVSV